MPQAESPIIAMGPQIQVPESPLVSGLPNPLAGPPMYFIQPPPLASPEPVKVMNSDVVDKEGGGVREGIL